jgi:PAS domain S-box-containing protein
VKEGRIEESNARMTRALVEYTRRQGKNPAELVAGLGVTIEELEDVRNWFPLELIRELFWRLRQVTGDPESVYKAGKHTIEVWPSFGVMEQTISVLARLGSLEMLYRRIPQLATFMTRAYRYRILYLEPGHATIEQYAIPPHPIFHDSCNYFRGLLEAIPTLGGWKEAAVREERCMVRIDQLERFDGKAFEVKDGRVYERDTHRGERKELGHLNQDGTFFWDGTVFGSDACVFNVSWKEPLGWGRRFRSYFFHKPEEYQGLIDALEKSNLLLEESHQELNQTTRELLESKTELEKSLDEGEYLRSYLESILDSTNASIIVVNQEGKVEAVNRETQRATGYSREEMLNKDVSDFIRLFLVTDGEPTIRHYIQGLFEGRERDSFELQFRTKGGEVRHGLFNTAWVDKGKNRGRSLILVGMDITQMKALEQQVIQTEKLASLGTLAAGIAHDLNNPLTIISADAQLLKSRVGEKDMEKVNRILEGVERIRVLVRDLTTYARFDVAGKEWVDLNQLIERSFLLLHYEIRKGGFELVLDLSTQNPRVFGNLSALEQVVVNLILNSIQAMIGKTGKILVKTCIRPNGWVEFRVEDQGVGISEENMTKVFEPFFSTKKGGTGLGLSNVLRIVNEHQGKVKVESRVGVGTTSIVVFPGEQEIKKS